MTGLIILAAGESRRLGQVKQNLIYQHKTLLQRAVETALNSVCRPIFVVLGANSELITRGIEQAGLTYLYNADWAEGMASAIRMAVTEIDKDSSVTGAIIMVCDQPFVTTALIDTLVLKKQETGKCIIACSYNDTVGVPVLFDRTLFNDLKLLKGNEGAKKIVVNYNAGVVQVSFEAGSIDIDTLADYERLKTK